MMLRPTNKNVIGNDWVFLEDCWSVLGEQQLHLVYPCTCFSIHVTHKVQIRTICRLSCVNLGYEIFPANVWIV